MPVSIRQQKRDGQWYVHIRHNSERVAQRVDSQEEAEAVAAAVRHKIALNEYKIEAAKQRRQAVAPVEEKPKAQTLGEFFDKTMAKFWESSLSNATYSRYEVSFRLHVRPILGDIPIDELTREQIKDFVVSLLQKNATKRTHGEERQAEEADRKLSKDSIRNVVATLRAMLNEAVERKLVVANQATRLGKLYREAGSVHEQVDPFTAEDIPLLLNATRTHFGYESYVLTLMLFHTGLRSSEIAGLQWQWIIKLERSGRLPAIKTASGVRLFRRSDIEAFKRARKSAR